MSEEILKAQDIVAIVRRHVLLILLSVGLCGAAAVAVAKTLPKKFKATAVLNLKGSYFEIPGVGGGLSYAEVQAQKQALLQLALSESFLDAEGEKYHLFKSEPGTPARESEREGLRKKVDFMSVSTTSFRVAALGRTAQIAYGLTSDVLDQVVSVLAAERRKTILAHRESLMRQVESMGAASVETPSTGGSGTLAKMEAQLKALRAQYTSQHPLVLAMEKKVARLRKQAPREAEGDEDTSSVKDPETDVPPARVTPMRAEPVRTDPGIAGSTKGRRSDFSEELLKKINYLDIALDLETNKNNLLYLEILERPVMPEGAIFPNTLAFGLGGVMLGAFLAALAIAFVEMGRANQLTSALLADRLGLPLLGTLPDLAPDPVDPGQKGSPKGATP